MRSDGTIRCDWRHGRHYGYPLCCIVWFVTVWRVLSRWNETAFRYHDWSRNHGFQNNRVPCPWCAVSSPKIARQVRSQWR